MTITNEVMIIGITGYLGAGKGKAAEYIEQKYGFAKRGYGDVIRAELQELGMPIGRDAEYHHANVQRQRYGFGYWSKKIVESIKRGEDVVVEGIRNPRELPELMQAGDLILVAVTAPLELRFTRMQKRQKEGDPTTLKELQEKEAREIHSDDPVKQNIAACVAKADYIVDNSGDEQHLHQQLDQIMQKVLNRR